MDVRPSSKLKAQSSKLKAQIGLERGSQSLGGFGGLGGFDSEPDTCGGGSGAGLGSLGKFNVVICLVAEFNWSPICALVTERNATASSYCGF